MNSAGCGKWIEKMENHFPFVITFPRMSSLESRAYNYENTIYCLSQKVFEVVFYSKDTENIKVPIF